MFHQIPFVAKSFSTDDTAVSRRPVRCRCLLSLTAGAPSSICSHPVCFFMTGRVVTSPPFTVAVIALGCRDVRGGGAGRGCGEVVGVHLRQRGLVFISAGRPDGIWKKKLKMMIGPSSFIEPQIFRYFIFILLSKRSRCSGTRATFDLIFDDTAFSLTTLTYVMWSVHIPGPMDSFISMKPVC